MDSEFTAVEYYNKRLLGVIFGTWLQVHRADTQQSINNDTCAQIFFLHRSLQRSLSHLCNYAKERSIQRNNCRLSRIFWYFRSLSSAISCWRHTIHHFDLSLTRTVSRRKVLRLFKKHKVKYCFWRLAKRTQDKLHLSHMLIKHFHAPLGDCLKTWIYFKNSALEGSYAATQAKQFYRYQGENLTFGILFV
jgi:hypothetical protein